MSYFFIGLALNAKPLYASFGGQGNYQLIKSEDGQDPKHRARQFVSRSKGEEKGTVEVKPLLHPAYEQYMLSCKDKGINCNIEELKTSLLEIYKKVPDSSNFINHLNARYSFPLPLAEQFYHAIQKENPHLSASINLLKKISTLAPQKKEMFNKKVELLYLKEEADLKSNLLFSLNGEKEPKDTEFYSYRLGKLNYYYALTLEFAPEKKHNYLMKAQEEFANVHTIKLEKVKNFRERLKGLLEKK